MVAPTAYGKNRFKQTHHNGSFGISTILGRGRRPRQPENKRFNTPHTTTDYLDFCHTCRGRRPRRPANKHFNQTTPQRLISISTIRRRGDHWSSATNVLIKPHRNDLFCFPPYSVGVGAPTTLKQTL